MTRKLAWGEGSALLQYPLPSYLGILDKEARAVAVGALRALPAAGAADAAHTALAAHTIPVTCCGRQKPRAQSSSWPCQQLTGSLPSPMMPSGRMYLGCLG